MRRAFFFAASLIACVAMTFGCGTTKPVQPTSQVIYTYKDSTVIKDSLRIVDLPVERIVDVAAVYDTLELETSLAKSRAWVDFSKHVLAGEIENKTQAKIRVEYKERLIYRDSIYTKEVPVPYEVEKVVTKYPTLFWILLAFAVIVIGKNVPKLIKLAKGLASFDWKKLMFWKNKKQ